jgi:membrane protein
MHAGASQEHPPAERKQLRRRAFPLSLANAWSIAKETLQGWSDHRGLRLGASLAYYTVFAMAPLFLIVLAIAGFVFGDEAANRQLFGQIAGLVGKEGGEAIQAMVAGANRPHAGMWATAIAVVTLFIGAAGVFVELQDALNTIWQVRQKAGNSIRHFIKARLLSFAMVVAMGFLLLVSLIISAGLAALGKFLSGILPAEEIFWQIANFIISLGIIAAVFAAMFKYLPDVRIPWRDVWLGALVAAILFDLGKFALGLYLGRSSFNSIYGAAGSLVIILLWVYYSSQTLFLGAEFTRVKAKRSGRKLQPRRGGEFIAIKELKSDQPEEQRER